jgi:hypothetical protein
MQKNNTLINKYISLFNNKICNKSKTISLNVYKNSVSISKKHFPSANKE